MPNRKPTKREMTSARRKDAILAAAVSCIIQNGYHQTGVRDIAKKADVSLGNLYNYFSCILKVVCLDFLQQLTIN